MTYGKMIGRALERAEILIGGVRRSPGVQEELGRFGFTPEFLQEMENILNEAASLASVRDSKYAKQLAISRKLRELRKEAELPFNVTREQARIALADDYEGQQALRLEAGKPRTIGDLLHQARRFYDNAPAYLEKLKLFGITQERLDRERQTIEEVGDLNIQQETAKGEAQEATGRRDEKMKRLHGLVQALETTAKEVYKERNEILVRLGMVQQGGRSSAYRDDSEIWSGVLDSDDDAGSDVSSEAENATAEAETRESAPEDAGTSEKASGANPAADDNATERPMREQLSEGDRRSGGERRKNDGADEERQQNTG